jgi:putative nucleotidyltransferase with HDIG domain
LATNDRYRHDIGSPVGLLITLSAAVAAAALTLVAPTAVAELSAHPLRTLEFLALTLALQITSVPVHGSGRISVSAVGILATGFVLGPGAAMTFALLAALLQWIWGRGLLHRAIFDAAQFVLAAGAGAAVYRVGESLAASRGTLAVAACVAGIVYTVVNHAFLCLAIGLSESQSIRRVWRDRFRWGRIHYVSFGPLAYASAAAYDAIGILGLVAFSLPSALLLLSMRQYLERTRAAVDEVRSANAELTAVNAALEERNADLRDLFEFTGGLAAHGHDRGRLVAFSEAWLSETTNATARIRIGIGSGGIALVAGGKQVGSLSLVHDGGFDEERWRRIREAIVPQLATAIESAELVEQVRRTHLATIAALSRSIEAKDNYTGDHTERVAAVAVALAKRLGYDGAELDAIEIGALLHDVGKIGVPERILQKEGPLDDEEWEIMRKHPVLSEYILAEVDLPPVVREIARWSHERVDGKGYPDGLDGNAIPLPARIVLVADALDAMTSDRPYRAARHLDAAIDELRANAGSQFCPTVIAALEEIYGDEPHVLSDGQLHVVAGGLDGDADRQAEPFEAIANLRDLPLARLDQRQA